MHTFPTIRPRRAAPVTPRPLSLALALALGITPLSGLAATLLTVTTSGDSGSGSTCTLRQAIASMNAHSTAGTNCATSAATSDSITFDLTTFPVGGTNTILLADVSTGTLQVTDSPLTIDAGNNGGVTIERPTSHTNLFGILNASTAGGSLTLKHLTLKGGATGACGNNGGGICTNGILTLINSTISDNSSITRGGGIFSGYGGVNLTNSTLSGNSSANGGGIFSLHSGVTVTNSTLSGNSAPGGSGGGIEVLSGGLIVTGSTFTTNAARYGGGTFSNNSHVTFINSTLSGNTSSQVGGGIYTTNGDNLSVTNCTLSANSSGYNGGIGSTHFFTVTNSIVAGNGGGDTNPIFFPNAVGNFIGGNPQLGALADNGGPTQTMLPLPASPVIDAIACTDAPATDQRGIARPQGAQCDIGAVEVGHPASLTVDTTADTQVIDGQCSLREAITIFAHGRPIGADCPPSSSSSNQIVFAPALANASIALSSPLVLDNNVEVTIDGAVAPGLAIDGGNATFIFNVSAGSTVAIQHLQMVNGNSAGSDGGAIDNAGTLTLTDTALNNNTSNSGGGAINNLATLNINRSTLSNNLSSGSGGAISAQSGVLTMTASTVIDNLAAAGGGVFVASGATLNLIGSNISINHALGTSGGGVAGNGHFIIANSTFSGNTAAADGGAIYNNMAANTNKIVNSTFAGNTAANGGNLANAAGTLLMQNTIVANSNGGNNCQGAITPGTGFMTWPASDTTCGAFTRADPVLGPLQNNGGPTFTMLPGAGSAVIDAGNSATCAAAPVSNRDQRSVGRPQGAACDIGAVEIVSGRIFADNFDGTPTP